MKESKGLRKTGCTKEYTDMDGLWVDLGLVESNLNEMASKQVFLMLKDLSEKGDMWINLFNRKGKDKSRGLALHHSFVGCQHGDYTWPILEQWSTKEFDLYEVIKEQLDHALSDTDSEARDFVKEIERIYKMVKREAAKVLKG
jgi:hypothetical protein